MTNVMILVLSPVRLSVRLLSVRQTLKIQDGGRPPLFQWHAIDFW